MTNAQKHKANKLIARFMKALSTPSYDKHWDSLIPVVEKIEKGNYGFKMCRKVVEVYIDDTKEVIIRVKEKNRLQSCYKAVIEFVKYHNNLEKVKNCKHVRSLSGGCKKCSDPSY